jgi:hypothetical protein
MDPAEYLVFGACIECGAGYGEAHWPECGAALSVPHSGWLTQPVERAAAAEECRRRGWSAAFVAGEGWRPCAPRDEGACLDLGRYAFWLEHGEQMLAGADGPGAPEAL